MNSEMEDEMIPTTKSLSAKCAQKHAALGLRAVADNGAAVEILHAALEIIHAGFAVVIVVFSLHEIH